MKDRIPILTGADSGISRATAPHLAAWYKVVLADNETASRHRSHRCRRTRQEDAEGDDHAGKDRRRDRQGDSTWVEYALARC